MAKKVSKFFRIGVEGDTCDGRVISAQDIQEMAETFDPRVYGCRISGVLHQSGYWSGRYLHGNAGQSVRL